MIPSTQTITSDHLAHELDRLGVPFVRSQISTELAAPIPPASLLAALAMSDEARLRLALIPLFLVRPEFAAQTPAVAAQLSPPTRLLLICYYTAAVLLQQLHAARLEALVGPVIPLPDHFAGELDIPLAGPPLERLHRLAARHALLSGEAINWLGTYQHGAERLLTHLEKAVRWQS